MEGPIKCCIVGLCSLSNVLTIEGEVSKQGRDQIDHKTKKDTDIGHSLHSLLCGSEKHT